MLLLVACGSREEPPLDASDVVDSGTLSPSDARVAQFCENDAAACPSSPPMQGTPCDGVGLECEWGSACTKDSALAVCTSSGWGLDPPLGTCDALAACPDLDAGCGMVETCTLPNGWCTCSYANASWSWSCRTGDCPPERPRIGTACVPPKEVDCFYPNIPCDKTLRCECGLWQARTGSGCKN